MADPNDVQEDHEAEQLAEQADDERAAKRRQMAERSVDAITMGISMGFNVTAPSDANIDVDRESFVEFVVAALGGARPKKIMVEFGMGYADPDTPNTVTVKLAGWE